MLKLESHTLSSFVSMEKSFFLQILIFDWIDCIQFIIYGLEAVMSIHRVVNKRNESIKGQWKDAWIIIAAIKFPFMILYALSLLQNHLKFARKCIRFGNFGWIWQETLKKVQRFRSWTARLLHAILFLNTSNPYLSKKSPFLLLNSIGWRSINLTICMFDLECVVNKIIDLSTMLKTDTRYHYTWTNDFSV